MIRSQGATTLQDALRNVPGISYAAAEGGTQSNMVCYLRGFPVNQDLYIDGIRDLGEYNRDLFATESVEVLKGPSALMFGRGSTGGLINQTSQDRRPAAAQGRRSSTFGSFDKKRLTGDLNVQHRRVERVPHRRPGRGLGLLPLSAGRGEGRRRAELALGHRRAAPRSCSRTTT